MNEQIKKLWDDAALASGDETETWDGQVAFMALFAELVIKETLQVARAGIEYGNGMEDAVYKYFGVEQ